MPDISKCSGLDCPLKEKCYRYTSEPSQFWQTYSEYYKSSLNKLKTQCSAFMAIWKK